MDNHFGWGDFLYMLALTPLFLPETFIVFIICSLVFSLIGGLTVNFLNKRVVHGVPLAGWQSIFLMAILDISWINTGDFNYGIISFFR